MFGLLALKIANKELRLRSRAIIQQIRKLREKDKRSEIWGRFRRRVHQTTAHTALNRYPKAFNEAQQLLQSRTDLKLLSFGCSTGEEVVSLRSYFPGAKIVGAEVNFARLIQCRKLQISGAIDFVRSTDHNIAKHGPYDAIFAMSVLQRLPHKVVNLQISDLSRFYPFSKFETQVQKLDNWLKPGGLLVIQNTQYRFRDTDIALRYRVHNFEPDRPNINSFDRASRLMPGEVYAEIIFEKQF